METMNSQKASVEDILKSDVKAGEDFEVGYDALEKAINEGKTRILRHENTLLIYSILGNNAAKIDVATLDSSDTLIKCLQEFMKAFKIAGFKVLYMDEDNQQMTQLLKMAGYSMSQKQLHADNNQSSVQLTIEVK